MTLKTNSNKQMLCTLWVVLASLLMPLGAWAQTEPSQEGDFYLISNADELIWFRNQVNSGETKIKGKLIADIDLETMPVVDGSNFAPIGNESYAYAGHFNGQFHRIKNMHITGGGKLGFFGIIGNNSKIEGVIIDKSCSVTGTGGQIGGVVGHCPDATYTITINNCGNEATIQGKEMVGGIFGGIRGNVSGRSKVYISNCYNTGTITATEDDAYTIAGYVGSGNAYLSNCWNTGTCIAPKSGKSTYITRTTNYVSLSNCYALNGTPLKVKGNNFSAISFKSEQLANGELTSMLNKGKIDGTQVWYQKIGEDTIPVFVKTDENTVYKIQNLACDAKTIIGYSYANNNDPTISTDHRYGVDGFCTLCHAIQPADLIDGYYEIANAGNLIWFRDQVNSGNTTINGKLTADIDLEGIDFEGIGDTDHTFSGHFDGQFHCVNNMKLYRKESVIGFFRYAGGGAIIENLIIGATSSIESDTQTAGGIVGLCKVAGSLTIRRCGNEATVTAPKVVAGIVGCMLYNGESDELHIVDCYNCGNVIAGQKNKVSMFCGQIDVPQDKIEIKNCWNSGNLFGAEKYSINAINNRTSYTSDLQYTVKGSHTMFFNSKTDCTKFTSEQLTNGELTSMLSNGVTDGTQVWYQKIGEDEHPVFAKTANNTVYCISDLACDGQTPEGCHYSNDADAQPIIADHNEAEVWDDVHYNYDITCQKCHETLRKCFHYDSEHTVTATKDEDGNWNIQQSITLTDEYGYEAPTTFTADAVTYSRTLSNGYKWGSLLLPFEVSSNEEVQLYLFSETKQDAVVLTPVAKVEAHTPCLFKKLGNDNDPVTFTAKDVQMDAVPDTQIATEDAGSWQMFGTYQKLTGQTSIYFVAKDAFYYAADGAKVTFLPFRSWLVNHSSSDASTMRICIDEETTVIDAITDVRSTQQSIYDLQGHRLHALQKGLNIVNGKITVSF